MTDCDAGEGAMHELPKLLHERNPAGVGRLLGLVLLDSRMVVRWHQRIF